MKLRIKNLWCLLYRNVADDVLFQKHFTDLDDLHSFLRYERFVNVGICKHDFKFTCPAAAEVIADLPYKKVTKIIAAFSKTFYLFFQLKLPTQSTALHR